MTWNQTAIDRPALDALYRIHAEMVGTLAPIVFCASCKRSEVQRGDPQFCRCGKEMEAGK